VRKLPTPIYGFCDAINAIGYDASGNVIETHEHKGEFKEW